MRTEKVTELLDELLRELMIYDYEEQNGIHIDDFRDDAINLSEKWDKFRGIEVGEGVKIK